MAIAVAITRDLIFSTKITGTGKALGLDARAASLPSAARAALSGGDTRLVFVDMALPDSEGVDAIAHAAGLDPRPTIVAFYSHVDAKLAQMATAAGADITMPRSRFSEELPAIFQKYCGPAAS